MGWKKKKSTCRVLEKKKSTANQMLTLPLIYGPQSNHSYHVCVSVCVCECVHVSISGGGVFSRSGLTPRCESLSYWSRLSECCCDLK